MTGSAAPMVLLVEDNPMDVFVIRETLETCGVPLSLRVATDGQEALRYLHGLGRDKDAECPALVLLDLNLPRISGMEVLRELRRGLRCKRTPVVIVSSSVAVADLTAAREFGVEAYFQKPADLGDYMKLGLLIKSILQGIEKH